ncbi:AttT protein [Geomicrobium sp. JCM 19037]|uniref:GNAT family N-acetyltransferase n=1 Tax=Geomicrobium sp. JCM 19037 TaxID=1460634 RepID=UPI00045F2F1F|nr:GNAT family N-acetyltransferase [Geomicrobium sp. JCM 19037]GAK02103.1 AttT protein [Geomicrobium sp. JCM 19037]
MKNKYEVSYAAPRPEQYNELRLDGGLSGKSIEAAEIGLENSQFVVCLYDHESLIGMGRVIGDGATFFQVVDIVVKPTHQGQGLAKVIMTEITNYLDAHTYPGSYVSLIADGRASDLYEQYGFQFTAPRSQGMYRKY